MIQRTIEDILLQSCGQGKVVVLSGARQVGKTTIAQSIANKSTSKTLWLNGDEPDIREMLSDTTTTQLKQIIGKHKLLIIDEAQRITNIGLTLKLLVDNFPSVQVIATGSSSFDLANLINEPLTGRKYGYYLYPLSFKELSDHSSLLEEKRNLEHRLIYGSYPEVVNNPGDEKEILHSLTDSYLYKDLLTFEKLKKPALLEKLLQALALQLGCHVSYNELGQTIGADNQTVEWYINLLEKTYVIFRLGSFSRNLRNELKKSRKVYFFDNGIRNAIIKNFSPILFREDKGALWENYLISERVKANHYNKRWVNCFFWRTTTKQEIDFIEEVDGKISAFEFKWNPEKKVNPVKSFMNAYSGSEWQVISPDNYVDFLLKTKQAMMGKNLE